MTMAEKPSTLNRLTVDRLASGKIFAFLALNIFLACQILLSPVGAETRQDEQSTDQIAERAYEKAEWVFEHAADVKYEHYHHIAKEQVRDESGALICRNDCSGFISYIIHTVAPKHYTPIREAQRQHPYPQAKIYANFFGSLHPTEPRDGWLQIDNALDLRRGDFIAWEKGESKIDHGGHGNSGHVMMVRDRPEEPAEERIEGKVCRLISIPVIDSSSVRHFAPETLPPNARQSQRDGLGKGTVRILLNGENKAIGYWEGTFWGEGQKEIHHPTKSGNIFFARMVSNRPL